jgi:hypothetical protein
MLAPLDVVGAQGEFRRHCIALFEALQERADQIVEMLAVFVEDPLSNSENLAETKEEWEEKVRIIKGKLSGVDTRLAGFDGTLDGAGGMTADMHVAEIIKAPVVVILLI